MATKGKAEASLEELEREGQGVEAVDLQAQVEALQAEVERLKAQNGRLMNAPEEGDDFAGWIIRTPVEDYTGVTAHVKFQNGVGLVDRRERDAERLVRILIADFHYAAERATAAGMDDVRRLWSMDGYKGPDKTLADKLLAAGV